MTTSTTHQSPRIGLSGAPRHVPDSPILASQSIQISPEQHARDMSDLCYALRCVNGEGMPDSSIAELAEFLLQSVDKDCINLTVGPQYKDLMEELQNTLQIMNFHCWAVLSERHNRLNGTPGDRLLRSLTLPECTSTSMREQPENFQHLFLMLSFVGVRRLNLHTDDGVHDLRDVCMLRGLEEISVLAPVAPERWLLLVRSATSVEILGSELPAAIRVHCDAQHDMLHLATLAEATASLAQTLHTPPGPAPGPAQAEVPAATPVEPESPKELAGVLQAPVDIHCATQVQSLVDDREGDTVKVHFTPVPKPVTARKKRQPVQRPHLASTDAGAADAQAARARSPLMPCEELQQPKQAQPATGSQIHSLRRQRSAVHPSSMALLALFGTAMFAGGLRQCLDGGPQFEPGVDPHAGTGDMSLREDSCAAPQGEIPDLGATLGASRHVLRESDFAQPMAVDTRLPEAGVDVLAQPARDLMEGKGFDGKPGLLVALGSGHTADVAEYMKRLAALGLGPALSAAILGNAADEYHALAHAMLNQHINCVAAFMDGLKALRLDSGQIADILAARGSRGYSGLHVALVEEKSAAVAEFMDRLKGLGLDPQQMADVVLADNINGYPGLFYAMERGSSLSVPVFMAGLKELGLPAGQLVDILKARDGAGNSGLFIAQMSGHAAVVTTFMQGLKGLGLDDTQIVDIIKCENTDGVGGLYMALQYGHTGVVQAFMKGLKALGLSPEGVAEVIAARNPSGATGLSVAMDLGHAQAVRAFVGSLKGLGLSPQQIADITRRRNPEVAA
jgi:ankyrin repeat protein